jgi:biopolymer transport protein ExbB
MIRETITNLLLNNHPLVLLLRLLSMLCLAMILDRALFWLFSALRYRPLPADIYDGSESKKSLLLAQLRAARHRHYTREVLLACLESPGCKDRIGQTVSEVLDRMSSKLNALELVAKIAPLVGILGTVVGLIMSFCEVGAMANASPTAISKGIGVALKTTADGLVISISASVACVGFKWCIHRAMLKMGRIVCATQYAANVSDLGHGSGRRE